MDLRKIKKLIELLEESGIAEIEVKEGEESIKLSRATQVQQPIMNMQNLDIPSQVSQTPESSVKAQENKIDPISDGDTIDSPMVGTFYASASPGAKPFISIGDIVSEGDVVCIVEAMKMMNEIKSEFSGKVLSVNVENSEPVEYGQSLFEISK